MLSFIKNFIFTLFFINGLILNIFQILVHFEYNDVIADFMLNLVLLSLLASFWLTSAIPICYIIGILGNKFIRSIK